MTQNSEEPQNSTFSSCHQLRTQPQHHTALVVFSNDTDALKPPSFPLFLLRRSPKGLLMNRSFKAINIMTTGVDIVPHSPPPPHGWGGAIREKVLVMRKEMKGRKKGARTLLFRTKPLRLFTLRLDNFTDGPTHYTIHYRIFLNNSDPAPH